jgi:hypothetical protein
MEGVHCIHLAEDMDDIVTWQLNLGFHKILENFLPGEKLAASL